MKKNKLILLLLAFIFIAPSLSAYLLYQHPTWRSGNTTNKGELISPAPQLTLFDEPKWHIVFWSPNACEKTCIEHLKQLKQLRLALGRRYYDVDLWVISPKTQQPKEQDIRSSNQYIKQLSTYPTSIFIATPQQRLILRYDSRSKLDDIYHDLKHLLTTTDGKNVS